MRNIKLTIAYDGSRYRGWQRLGDSDKTIQGKIEAVLSRLTGEAVEINGSGRTDAGAHANAQIANFKTQAVFTIDELLEFCRTYLPNDIVVYEAKEMPDQFHARLNAVSKRYLYRIDNGKFPSVFDRYYAWHIERPLLPSIMREAAELLCGKHDFTSFTSDKAKSKSVRTINSIEIVESSRMIEIIYDGDGFLYNMVRIMTGTLVEIGLGERKVNNITEIFDAKNRTVAGQMAPAHGLFLQSVSYKKPTT